jgi:predicted nucleotidyltransferase
MFNTSTNLTPFISQQDLAMIALYAKQYQVQAVYLFGSALDTPAAHDIDLAVLGIPPGYYFKFYGKLLRHLSKPVDIVDLSKQTLFNELIKEKAVKIYEQPK